MRKVAHWLRVIVQKAVFAHGELEVLSGEDQQDWL